MNATPNRPSRVLHIAVAVFLLIAIAGAAQADIFQWEYINPADPSQGKQQSTTLAPDGAGVDAVPGADLTLRNLTMGYLNGADLQHAKLRGTKLQNATLVSADLLEADLSAFVADGGYYYGLIVIQSDLTSADFSEANLTNANFDRATLTRAVFTGAQLTGAEVTSADFASTTSQGFTAEQLYSTASYQRRDLRGISLSNNDLSGWSFAGQNLANAHFGQATLAAANLTGAEIRGASFRDTTSTGFTAAQLYSTGSYQAHGLGGIDLSFNDLTGWNFSGQYLGFAELYGANLTGAEVRGAAFTHTGFSAAAQLYSTASYQARDLTGIGLQGINLSGWNFRDQNLTNANFSGADLTDADFTGAQVRSANFSRQDDFVRPDGRHEIAYGPGITLAQLYSTASYQAHDLSRINLIYYNNLADGNFAGQNLTNANFSLAWLTGADFTGADARGAYLDVSGSTITTNLIRPNGHISGLDLDAGGLLIVHDYDDFRYLEVPRIPITVDQHLSMGPGGTLRMVFEADAWNSTISFAPGIPVTLGGTLELTFADDVNLASQVGRTLKIFDWTGVNPTGAFAVSSPYTWDLSNLYTTGEVTLVSVPEPATIVPAAAAAFCGTRLRRRFRAASKLGKIGKPLSGSETPPTVD